MPLGLFSLQSPIRYLVRAVLGTEVKVLGEKGKNLIGADGVH